MQKPDCSSNLQHSQCRFGLVPARFQGPVSAERFGGLSVSFIFLQINLCTVLLQKLTHHVVANI